MNNNEPYKVTAVWDEHSLPQAIKSHHSTKPGVWGVLRVLEGEVRLVFENGPSAIVVTPTRPALIPPEEKHHVEIIGAMRMQVEFYKARPNI